MMRPVGRLLEVEQSDVVQLLALAAEQGTSAWIRARGASMHPAIPHESDILVRPARCERCRVGAVVVAVGAHGLLVVHRIVRADETRVWLRGDHCVATDAAIPRQQVIGFVEAVRTNGHSRPVESRSRRSPRYLIARWYGHVRRRLAHG